MRIWHGHLVVLTVFRRRKVKRQTDRKVGSRSNRTLARRQFYLVISVEAKFFASVLAQFLG
jgi:hypothetical protein